MALLARGQASLALLNAMLAVAAFHYSGAEAALPYKSNAVRCLINSLRFDDAQGGYATARNQDNTTDTQIAASMMLCVYSVSSVRQTSESSVRDINLEQGIRRNGGRLASAP